MTYEHDYLDLLRHVLDKGEDRADRTGTGTRSIFGVTLNINLREGFPLLTTKAVPFRSVLSELLWFIEGSGDERRLAEILHGTRDFTKKTIWSPNAEGTTGSKFSPTFKGDLGRIYGVQWRSWLSTRMTEYGDYLHHHEADGSVSSSTYFRATVQQTSIDQLADVIHKLRTNPTDRRIIMTAWNPGELDQMALPPCHMTSIFNVSNDGHLNCMMTQRSADMALGVPFNIASYALLTHMLAHVTGLKVGNLMMVFGDAHIYKDHFDAVKEQLSREPSGTAPRLSINRQVTNIDDFRMEDFTLAGYEPQSAIKLKMSA